MQILYLQDILENILSSEDEQIQNITYSINHVKFISKKIFPLEKEIEKYMFDD
jgi:hypothetical protein